MSEQVQRLARETILSARDVEQFLNEFGHDELGEKLLMLEVRALARGSRPGFVRAMISVIFGGYVNQLMRNETFRTSLSESVDRLLEAYPAVRS